MNEKVEMGDAVQDNVTGFQGIVVAISHYLEGCARVAVQPKVKKDGSLPEHQTFDEPRLKVIKKKVAKRGPTDIGGPDKYMDEGRY